MYSDGQSANFTGHSLDKYRIDFKQSLQDSEIYRYLTDLGSKPSKAVTIKNIEKRIFIQNVKTAKTIYSL
ncbi:hypothetical protein T11_11162 [Trichinella zimbabwensis]|uniref:Uncharacterized protein n=1 Tax=Trichinella zimbabwensis TaxID=268475 RepID=A0A0V1GPD3_9BILA|nr:hypothetical protein T11_11162 [Trichinella zimbabwensis]